MHAPAFGCNRLLLAQVIRPEETAARTAQAPSLALREPSAYCCLGAPRRL